MSIRSARAKGELIRCSQLVRLKEWAFERDLETFKRFYSAGEFPRKIGKLLPYYDPLFFKPLVYLRRFFKIQVKYYWYRGLCHRGEKIHNTNITYQSIVVGSLGKVER